MWKLNVENIQKKCVIDPKGRAREKIYFTLFYNSKITSMGFLACSITKDEMVGRRPELAARRGFGSPFIHILYVCLVCLFIVSKQTGWLIQWCMIVWDFGQSSIVTIGRHKFLFVCYVPLFALFVCLFVWFFCLLCLPHQESSCPTPLDKPAPSWRALPRCNAVVWQTHWNGWWAVMFDTL